MNLVQSLTPFIDPKLLVGGFIVYPDFILTLLVGYIGHHPAIGTDLNILVDPSFIGLFKNFSLIRKSGILFC